MRVAVIDRPGEIGDVDIVVLAVKNYSLEAVARQVHEDWAIGRSSCRMANGIDNQRILPKFFYKVIYGVVGYNARRDGPTVIGYQHKGPLLIGTPDNTLSAELRLVQSILARGCPTEITDRLQDAVHTKIVINLTNALDALVGRGWRPLSNLAVYQQLLSQTLWEGVRIIRAAGYHEHRIAGHPVFCLFARGDAAARAGCSGRCSRCKLRAMAMSSMTQDVALRGATDTELEIDHRLHRAARRGTRRAGAVQPRHLPAGPGKIPPRIRAATMRGGVGSGRARTQFAPGRRA